MNTLKINGIGMVTALGLNKKATSAAFRAGIENFQESHFLDGNGEKLLVAEIPLEKPWRGKVKMLKMAARAILEANSEANLDQKQEIPTLICLSEKNGLGLELDEQQFFNDLQQETGVIFHQDSGLIRKGKSGCVSALQYAQTHINNNPQHLVRIVATDTLLTARLVNKFTENRWLLTRTTSNGFIPGEAAVCMIFSKKTPESTFSLLGKGSADESYKEGDEVPFLAEGLTAAVKQTLQSAKQELSGINLWFSHNSTTYLSAKESTLTELKLLRGEEIQFQRHSLTQSFGEVGASAGLLMLALSKDLLPFGGTSLITMANFDSRRAALLSRVEHYG